MAEWATFKAEKGIMKFAGSLRIALLITVLGFMLARANILGVYPFAIAFTAALALEKVQKVPPALIGVILGIVSLQDLRLLLGVLSSAVLCSILIPRIKEHKGETALLAVLTALFTFLPNLALLGLYGELREEDLILLASQGALAAGFSVIFLYAFHYRECLFKGSFRGGQAMVWILTLAVCLSGLQGLQIGPLNIQIVVLSFAILFIADRLGAGSGAGAGAILGFLLKWSFGIENLIDAGIYGLLGFICGGFRHLGRLGVAASFTAAVLMITFFVNEGFLEAHLYSSGLGLIFFLLLPGRARDRMALKARVMPEIETTVSKVKTLAEIFDQLAFNFQAAGLESKLQPEVPELMNVLVDRVCKNCPTINYCWEREFYRTYNFLFDMFAYLEEDIGSGDLNPKAAPSEWKKYCGKLEELMLGAGFILEQQKDREVWQKRLALNRDSLADQYRNVSQVIGHLAQELHSKHNLEEGRPLVWSRQHRLALDLGMGSFIKSGNGISGDNYNSVPLSPHKNALIVCDGMGAGEEAARMSSAALTILEQLLSTGFEPEGAVKALNSILVLRSPEESFVTVDMAVLDLESESARLIKIGAAPTYVVEKNKVEIIQTSSLPAGILNDIEIPVIDIPFKEETLVIVTDGILDVAKQDNWLKVFLEGNTLMKAQELADNIIKEAMNLAGSSPEDDGVVLVVRRK